MRSSLGTLLIEAGVASKKDIKDALAEGQQTGERLGEVVIRKGLATDELIAKLLAEQWQLPYAEADDIIVDEVAALRISRSDARDLRAQPISYDGDTIIMAIAEPRSDLFAEVAKTIGDAAYVVVSRSTMEKLLGGPLPPVADDGSDYDDQFDKEHDMNDVNGFEPVEGSTDGSSYGGDESVAVEEQLLEGDRRDEVTDETDLETGLSSIDTALEEFDRLRGVTAGLGDALRSVRDQLVGQHATVAELEAALESDRESIRQLEEELANQDELFATLREQAAAFAATLGETATSTR
jgi:Type II secretion system (T2SS), protein E, N-terminal domain